MPRGKMVESSQQKQHDIMMAALACFRSKGFSDTSMKDIQVQSGASIGSIYHHFESKEQLGAALYLDGLKGVHGAIRRVMSNTSDAEQGIKTLVQAYIDWFVQNPDMGHYLFQGMGAQYLELEGDAIREEVALLRHELGGWLRPHIDAGRIARLPVELYSPLMLGPTREFLQSWLVNQIHQNTPSPSHLNESTQALADAAWKALAPS